MRYPYQHVDWFLDQQIFPFSESCVAAVEMMVRCKAEGTTLGLESPRSFESFVERVYESSKEEAGKMWIFPSCFTLCVFLLLD